MVRPVDPEAKHYLTVREWAEVKGVPLERPQIIRLGMIVKGSYKEKYKRDPKEAYRRTETGKMISVGSGYSIPDIELIENGLKQLETEAEKKERKLKEAGNKTKN